MGRAGRRAAYHLLQALVESLKAVEAVIEELGTASDESPTNTRENGHKIDVE